MTDGNVALNGECGEGEGRGVHGEELAENHKGAAHTSPNPEVSQDVVGEHLQTVILLILKSSWMLVHVFFINMVPMKRVLKVKLRL